MAPWRLNLSILELEAFYELLIGMRFISVLTRSIPLNPTPPFFSLEPTGNLSMKRLLRILFISLTFWRSSGDLGFSSFSIMIY